MNKIKLSSIMSNCSFPGKRLDQALAQLFKDYSRSYLKQLIVTKQVTVNNIIVHKPDKKILGGEIITIYPSVKNISCDAPENILLNIIYEDKDILVINKPAGLVVHPGSGNLKGTILNAVLYHAKNNKNLPRAGIVHRLDKNTTGLMVVAKNIFSYKNLLQLLRTRNITREYQAIVKGNMISGGSINQPIMRHPSKRTCMMVHHLGKKSITYYKIIKRFKFHTHLLIKLETGRTHQIRVHMSYIKYPLVGDSIYGGINNFASYQTNDIFNKIYRFPRQALHAHRLSFRHPRNQNIMSWTIPLPMDMKNLLLHL